MLVDIVRRSSDQVDKIEDSVLVNRVAGHRAELSGLRRSLVRLERLLAPEPAALFRLLSRPPTWISEADIVALRQAAEEFTAVVADCTALVERAKLIQEEIAAMVTEQTNRSLFVLTFVTVLLLPFNVVGGLFGMNVGGIPYGDSPHGFWTIVLFICALICDRQFLRLETIQTLRRRRCSLRTWRRRDTAFSAPPISAGRSVATAATTASHC